MKNSILINLILIFAITSSTINAQANWQDVSQLLSNDYTVCAAVFFKDKMLVDEYSPEGKCKIAGDMKGKITVATIDLTELDATAKKQIAFKVAIINDETNTLWLYTNEYVKEIMLEDVYKECRPGDNIIIITKDKLYSLPHHEILLFTGC